MPQETRATGLFGFLGHALHLEVDWTVVVILGSTAMLGSYLGAQQTARVSPETLTRWMGGVMVITSLPVFWLAYIQFYPIGQAKGFRPVLASGDTCCRCLAARNYRLQSFRVERW
jgi:uncharacterized membrane protein